VFNYFAIGQSGYNIIDAYTSLKESAKDMARPA
jgi:hypothetical protein